MPYFATSSAIAGLFLLQRKNRLLGGGYENSRGSAVHL